MASASESVAAGASQPEQPVAARQPQPRLGSIDFKKRAGRFLETVHLTGDVKVDMDAIRRGYEGIEGRNLERQIPILLAEEIEGHSPQNK